MAATHAKRVKIAGQLGMFFSELGEIPDRKDYSKMPNRPKFLDAKEVDKVFGTWTRMLTMLEKEHPKLWELANKVPEKEKPTIESKMEKAKTVVKADDEGDDGKDI